MPHFWSTYRDVDSNHFPGQPIPMPDDPSGEEAFPNMQSKLPLV